MGLKTVVDVTYQNGGTGIRVNRAAAADLAAATPIFAITGGLVQVTGLYGVATVLHAGAANTIQFSHSTGPTVLCLATPAVASPVGTVYTITGDPGDLVVIGIGTGVANTFPPVQGSMKGSGAGGIQQFGMVMGVGNIRVTFSVVNAGSTRYVITYIPLDDAAVINAV